MGPSYNVVVELDDMLGQIIAHESAFNNIRTNKVPCGRM